jgi:hypothetical protein
MCIATRPLAMPDTRNGAIPGRRWSGAMLVMWSVGVINLAPSRLCAQEISDDWQFGAAIYGWLPDIGGHTSLPLADSSIDVDVSTILDHLEMTAQGGFEVQKGHWGAFTDVVYLDVGESKSQTRQLEIGGNPLPAGVTARADFDLKTLFVTLAGSYRVVASPETTFDVVAGARLASLKQELDWEFTGNFGSIVPPPRTGTREISVDQWDAIVGVRGQFRLGAEHKWVVPYYFDIGTGDSDMTLQAVVGLGYAFGWGDVDLVWCYVDYDLKANGPIEDLNFSGPALGAKFRW